MVFEMDDLPSPPPPLSTLPPLPPLPLLPPLPPPEKVIHQICAIIPHLMAHVK